MARGRFFKRMGQRVQRIFAPSPRGVQPPAKGPPRERGPRGDPWREVWRRHGGQGNYKKHVRVFGELMDSVDEDDPDERLELWESYVENIVRPRGRERRQSPSNMFWRDSGIDPQDFDWKAWREAMGYTGRRRSRTP